jgi:hypothetical protein
LFAHRRVSHRAVNRRLSLVVFDKDGYSSMAEEMILQRSIDVHLAGVYIVPLGQASYHHFVLPFGHTAWSQESLQWPFFRKLLFLSRSA